MYLFIGMSFLRFFLHAAFLGPITDETSCAFYGLFTYSVVVRKVGDFPLAFTHLCDVSVFPHLLKNATKHANSYCVFMNKLDKPAIGLSPTLDGVKLDQSM